ncbi:MAG TPA: ferrous iron transporter B [Spirochaetota bacterium]|jgi:ferrous iron transport protein B|nr:MAG: Ferrous iron transport protein B [Spirochaetes bacterium ADurb.Bin133]HNZ26835.1 ferrous iron transporter B [Spirochaetota bacterium]HPY88375.1 ferrous iron transporter B [Spirochaetota bacterium]HQB60345.1 ferrous iron transporter B [Spirochaetota bacterium]
MVAAIKKPAILIGNVNVGKTTIFNNITGKELKEVKDKETSISYFKATIKGSSKPVYDIPDISGLTICAEEEKTAINLLLNKSVDTIIQVVDAKNLLRSLALTLQIAEFGIPTIIALNMIDEAQVRGVKIDSRKLSERLNLEVIDTIANEREGTGKLISSIDKARLPSVRAVFPEDIESAIVDISAFFGDDEPSKRALAILLVIKDKIIEKYVSDKFGDNTLQKCKKIVNNLEKKHAKPLDVIISETYYFQANRITDSVSKKVKCDLSDRKFKLSRWTSRLFPGIPIAIFVALLMFLFVGKFGAEFLVDLLEGKLFNGIIIPFLKNILKVFNSSFITDLFCGEFGLISVGITLSFGVVLPVLFTFYIFFGYLEDSGYLPRVSILLDKALRVIGLNGKGVFPLIMGFSCITMALLTTRMLDTKKEKIIASFLLILGLPCAPLLSVMFVLFGKLHWSAAVIVFGVILFQVILSGLLLNKILPGDRGDFIIEAPPLRLPSFLPILKKATLRIKTFLIEAVPIFLIASFALFLFDKAGGLDLFRASLKPVTLKLLGLPVESVEIILMTIVRREAGAALLSLFFDSGIFNGTQTVVMLLIMTFLTPCINSMIVIFKERGVKTGLGIIGFVIPYALLVGAVVNFILTSLKVQL